MKKVTSKHIRPIMLMWLANTYIFENCFFFRFLDKDIIVPISCRSSKRAIVSVQFVDKAKIPVIKKGLQEYNYGNKFYTKNKFGPFYNYKIYFSQGNILYFYFLLRNYFLLMVLKITHDYRDWELLVSTIYFLSCIRRRGLSS